MTHPKGAPFFWSTTCLTLGGDFMLAPIRRIQQVPRLTMPTH